MQLQNLVHLGSNGASGSSPGYRSSNPSAISLRQREDSGETLSLREALRELADTTDRVSQRALTSQRESVPIRRGGWVGAFYAARRCRVPGRAAFVGAPRRIPRGDTSAPPVR